MIKNLNISDLTSLKKIASNFNLNLTKDDLCKQNDYYIGYIINDKIIGFLSYSIYYERAELNYIYVEEQYRNNNIATKMLNYVLEKINYLENITLEVRENNLIAIKLYEKCGFSKCAIRKNYYGKDNAILMIKKFGDNNE